MADLVVEDGTGLANADAFVSEADMDIYATDHDLTSWLDGTGDGPAAIRRATSVVSNGWLWKGYKVNGRNQALAWPRTDVLDEEDNAVDSASVPPEIVQATCELAAYERANPGALTPTVILANQVRRERVGALEVEYAGMAGDTSFKPIFMHVEDIISGLIQGGAPSATTGYVTRV